MHKSPINSEYHLPDNLPKYNISGKISGYNNKENFRGNFNWNTNSAVEYQINIKPNLSSISIKAQQKKNTAKLQMDSKTYNGRDISKILQKVIGWQLPTTQLVYWFKGLPYPSSCFEKKLEKDTFVLYQDGWKIEYKKYTKKDVYILPEKIFMEYGNYKIRLYITNWKID